MIPHEILRNTRITYSDLCTTLVYGSGSRLLESGDLVSTRFNQRVKGGTLTSDP